MGRNRRGRDKRERHGEWVSLGMESGESRFGSLEERIRGLAERIEGLERGTWKTEEKRGNTGSSSDGEEQNGKWKWDGESWWCKIEAADSRSVKAILGQETKRWKEWYQLRSRIEWLEAKEQQGFGQSKQTSRDMMGFQDRGAGFSGGEPVHVRSVWTSSIASQFVACAVACVKVRVFCSSGVRVARVFNPSKGGSAMH